MVILRGWRVIFGLLCFIAKNLFTTSQAELMIPMNSKYSENRTENGEITGTFTRIVVVPLPVKMQCFDVSSFGNDVNHIFKCHISRRSRRKHKFHQMWRILMCFFAKLNWKWNGMSMWQSQLQFINNCRYWQKHSVKCKIWFENDPCDWFFI